MTPFQWITPTTGILVVCCYYLDPAFYNSNLLIHRARTQFPKRASNISPNIKTP